MTLSDFIEVAGLFIGSIVSIAGLYLANAYSRQTKARLAEARRSAYAALWEATGLAAPSRLENAGVRGVLSPQERARMYQLMTDWYFRDGNGMLLAEPTRTMYLRIKDNLACEDKDVKPEGILKHFPSRMAVEQRRGCMSIRQISLLRSQLKADLAIFGVPFVKSLSRHEVEFLLDCGVDPRRKPWRIAMQNVRELDPCAGRNEGRTT